MNIRVATTADAEALMTFGAQAYIDTYAGHPMNKPEDVAAYMASVFTVPQFEKEIADGSHIFLVCETVPEPLPTPPPAAEAKQSGGDITSSSSPAGRTLSLESVNPYNVTAPSTNQNNSVTSDGSWSSPITVARFRAITNASCEDLESKGFQAVSSPTGTMDSNNSLIQYATLNSMSNVPGLLANNNNNGQATISPSSVENNESQFASHFCSGSGRRPSATTSTASTSKPAIMAYAKMCIGVSEDGLDTDGYHPSKTNSMTDITCSPPPTRDADHRVPISECKPMKLDRLYVGKEFLGRKGIGSIMMDECYKVARQHECEWVWLKVWEENRVAQTFYEKKGFRFVGKKVFQVGSDPQVALLMQKELLSTN
eukprot:GILI01002545.1.p1 GENE.GILI01002545.1~~GILI01002545.1.p1  ORF type:complete len:370 (+),score=60.20 GILI01002545.1:68-1177(+)